MSDVVFVDSNILIYAHDHDAGAKQLRAAACLRELWDVGSGRMSTQVLQEFCVNVTRKILRPLSGAAAREVVRKLSFWDSMIVAAAEQTAATELLTEDLNHGQIVAGIRIRNPFIPD